MIDFVTQKTQARVIYESESPAGLIAASEEEMDRVTNLLGERARQEQLLDEELKEVRDDNVEPGQAEKK